MLNLITDLVRDKNFNFIESFEMSRFASYVDKLKANLEHVQELKVLDKTQNSLRSPLKTLFINEKLEGYSKSSIENCIAYILLILQFSTWKTATTQTINPTVIHILVRDYILVNDCILSYECFLNRVGSSHPILAEPTPNLFDRRLR